MSSFIFPNEIIRSILIFTVPRLKNELKHWLFVNKFFYSTCKDKFFWQTKINNNFPEFNNLFNFEISSLHEYNTFAITYGRIKLRISRFDHGKIRRYKFFNPIYERVELDNKFGDNFFRGSKGNLRIALTATASPYQTMATFSTQGAYQIENKKVYMKEEETLAILTFYECFQKSKFSVKMVYKNNENKSLTCPLLLIK